VAVAAGADTLDYAYSSTGALAGSGTGSDAALGSGGTHLLTLSTTAAGLRSGTVSVVATSPQTASPTFSGTVSMNVLDHAIGSFSGTGTLKSLAIDFGTLIRGGDSGAAGFSIFNRPGSLGTGWTAKLDLDGVSTTAPMAIFSTSLVPFLGLSSGSSRAFGVSMAATTAGTFSGTYSLALSDEDLPGAISQSLSLSVRGSVIAASAGDTNYDGLIDIMDTANLVTSGRYGTGILADWEQGDFNADRLVDILDVADFLSTGLYNQGDYRNDVLANVAVVPEPTTQLAIWLVGGAMLMMIRRGRSRAASRATTGP
jgi:hypothetical protein